jgi:hypothetical protein
MEADAHLDEAARVIEQALVERPQGDGALFSLAAQHLSAARDQMARRQRAQGATEASRRALEHVNAVISIVLACHFPLGAIPWGELEKSRAWLGRIGADA